MPASDREPKRVQILSGARPRIHSRAPPLDAAENRALRPASIYPRIPVGCAAVMLRTRFTVFADRGARSRPFVNTRPSTHTQGHRMRACRLTADAQTPRRWTGKRASEAAASTSVNAFELRRVSLDVLSA